MPAADKKAKKGPSLPPKPALFTDDEWALAHSSSRLLELLSAPDASGKDKTAVSKQKAVLWLWQLLGSDPGAKEEAGKAKAAEVIIKLLTTPAADASLTTHALGCLEVLLSATAGDEEASAQATATCEAVLASKPPVVPWLLKQLEQPAGAGVVGAALGVLHALLRCAETRPLVSKITAGWDQRPLVAVLTGHQSMPLLGGRNASAHAAGILEVLCTPPPPAAAAAGGSGPTSSSKGKSGKEGGAKQPARAASASSKSGASSGGTAAAAGAGGDATLATALQQAVLVADGLPALLKVCTATGSTVACRCAAVNTLYHILAAHGHTAATKQELLTAQGLTTLVQVMVRTTLPLAARAAAAGCLYHYLAPLPHQSGTLQQAAAAADAAAAGRSAAPAAVSKPSSSPAATKSIIQQALQKRRQQHAGELRSGSPDGAQQQALQSDRPSTSKSSPTATGIRYEEGAGDAGAADAKATKRAVATAAVEWALPPAPGDTAAALATAQHEALLAHWDLAARRGLAACAEHVVSAGAVPALLLLCCGLDGPPEGLLEAAMSAAAKGPVSSTGSSSTCASAGEPADPSNPAAGAVGAAGGGGGLGSSSSPVAAPDAKAHAAAARRSSVSAGGAAAEAAAGSHVGEALDSIAEPSHAFEGEEEDASTTADDSRGNAAEGAQHKSGKKGAVKKGEKQKPAKLDPAMELAHTHASAALNLLALAGDAPRLALFSGGALPVLLPLLEGGVTAARWNARQALLSLSLVATCHSNSATPASSNGSTAQPTAPQAPAGPTAAVKGLPNYISLDNMPQSHWQPLVPPSMPAQPPLPPIPGRSRGDGGAASAGSAGGGSSGAGRPTSQGRRTSVSNLAALQPAVQSSRMSSTSSFMDGPAGAAAAAGAAGRAARGPRASAAMAVSATAAIAAMQNGASGSATAAAPAGARTSSTAGMGPPMAGAEQQL